jgi:hypothetical protein
MSHTSSSEGENDLTGGYTFWTCAVANVAADVNGTITDLGERLCFCE